MYALRELHSGVRVLFNLVPPPGDRVTSGFTQYLQYTGQNVCTNSVTLKTYYNKGVPGSRVHQGVLGCGVLAVDRADAHSVVRDESRCGRPSPLALALPTPRHSCGSRVERAWLSGAGLRAEPPFPVAGAAEQPLSAPPKKRLLRHTHTSTNNKRYMALPATAVWQSTHPPRKSLTAGLSSRSCVACFNSELSLWKTVPRAHQRERTPTLYSCSLAGPSSFQRFWTNTATTSKSTHTHHPHYASAAHAPSHLCRRLPTVALAAAPSTSSLPLAPHRRSRRRSSHL